MPNNIWISNQQIPSTQDLAKEEKDLLRPNEWRIYTASEQTKGRGTHHRKWASPPDVNVYVTYSFLLPSDKRTDSVLTHISQTAAIAIANMLQQEFDLKASIKWVNDVLLNQRKMCGILSEVETIQLDGKDYHAVFLGMGINVNMSQAVCDQLDQPVTSMAIAAGKSFDKNKVLQHATSYLYTHIDLLMTHGFSQLREIANEKLERYGNEIIIFDTSGVGVVSSKEHLIQGRIHSINEQGHLQLITTQGLKTFFSGRILKGQEAEQALAILEGMDIMQRGTTRAPAWWNTMRNGQRVTTAINSTPVAGNQPNVLINAKL